MAVTELKLSSFRGKDAEHKLDIFNTIRGANETGKSTIKEAICFAFCGTDSMGSRNPQHLISEGKDSCEVVVTTDRAVISRTLTRKGNGTLKVYREGIPTTFTQTQMEQIIGSVDTFLSAFIPGYFLDLPEERKLKVVSEIMPDVNRAQLFKDITGFDMVPEEQLRYAFNKRPDIIGDLVAADRRECTKIFYTNQGQLKQLLTYEEMAKPETPPELIPLASLRSLKSQWENYERDLRLYNNFKIQRDIVVKENEMRANNVLSLKEKLASLQYEEITVQPSLVGMEAEALAGLSYIHEPSCPRLSKEMEEEMCPTCGQTVGKKHKESIKQKNAELKAKHDVEVEAIKANNKIYSEIKNKVKEKYSKLCLEYSNKCDRNKAVDAEKRKIEISLAGLSPVTPPNPGEEPITPKEVLDASLLKTCEEIEVRYNEDMARYNASVRQFAGYSDIIANHQTHSTALEEKLRRLGIIEEGFKVLPQKEFEIQSQAFKIDGVEFRIGSKIEIYRDGLHFKLLSTGAAAKVGMAISRKINSLMKRPINMMFVDNADLIDTIPAQDLQMFLAIVTDDTEVTINDVRTISEGI